MEDTGRRLCKKCLVRELADQQDIYRTVRDYIDNLDSHIKASDILYEERLEICKGCDMLLAGMCRRCGCYVEMRAVVAGNSCPGKKW